MGKSKSIVSVIEEVVIVVVRSYWRNMDVPYRRTPAAYQFPWVASVNSTITSSLLTFSNLTTSYVIASANLSFSFWVLPLYICTLTIGMVDIHYRSY